MFAKVIDMHILAQVVGASLAAGIGITAIFGLVIYGGTRFADMRREGKEFGAVAFAAFAATGFVAFIGAVVLGIVVMANKS